MTIRTTTSDYTAYHSTLGIMPSDSSKSHHPFDEIDDDDDGNLGFKSHHTQQIFRLSSTKRRSDMFMLVGLCMVLVASHTVMHQKSFLVEQLAALYTTTTSKPASSSGKRVKVVGGGDNVVYKQEKEEDSVDESDNSDEVPSSSSSPLPASIDDETVHPQQQEEEKSLAELPPRMEVSSAQNVPKAAIPAKDDIIAKDDSAAHVQRTHSTATATKSPDKEERSSAPKKLYYVPKAAAAAANDKTDDSLAPVQEANSTTTGEKSPEKSPAQKKLYYVPKAAAAAANDSIQAKDDSVAPFQRIHSAITTATISPEKEEQQKEGPSKKKKPAPTKDENKLKSAEDFAEKESTTKAGANVTPTSPATATVLLRSKHPAADSKRIEEPKTKIPFPSSSSSFDPLPETPTTATKKKKEITKQIDNVPMDEFRLCRVQPEPVLGEKAVPINGTVLPVDYQCAGEPYEEFAAQLEQLIQHTAAYRKEKYKSRWGRRKQILPGQHNHNTKERSILIMGNSHTRQIASTLLCQYRNDILNATWLFSLPDNPSYGVLEVKLRHNLIIYIATNCPFVYSHHWDAILESPKILNRTLKSLDAIVVGRFNHYSESTGTKFYDAIMGYQRQLEGTNWKLDFEHIMPPTIRDVAKVYTTGPIVYVGMFAYYGLPLYEQAKEMAQNLTLAIQENRRRPQGTALINGRKYIHQLHRMEKDTVEAAIAAESTTRNNLRTTTATRPPRLPVQECVSDNIHNVSTCNMDTSNERHRNGHRCMGARGGHPDLLVWDLVDALHLLVPKETSIDRKEEEVQ